jgi:hypothetical protein
MIIIANWYVRTIFNLGTILFSDGESPNSFIWGIIQCIKFQFQSLKHYWLVNLGKNKNNFWFQFCFISFLLIREQN